MIQLFCILIEIKLVNEIIVHYTCFLELKVIILFEIKFMADEPFNKDAFWMVLYAVFSLYFYFVG